jgi:DNA-directed RNA polymerase specialized sigma24 family protein
LLTKWDFSHPNAHNGLGTPRRPIVVERSDLLPLREGKLALVSFLLLAKLWWEIDGGSRTGEFFWDGQANTPANSLYDTLHGSKQGWVDGWFGYAPPGGQDGSTRDVVKRLAGLLIAQSKFRSETAKCVVFYQFKSALVTNPRRYAFHSNTAPYTPLRPMDVSIEWGPHLEESITDPDLLLSLALTTLSKGSWSIETREHVAARLGLPESLRRWLEAPRRNRPRPASATAPVIPLPDEKLQKARVAVKQLTEIRASTENLRLVAKLRVFEHMKDVSLREKRELIYALEEALGLHEVAGDEKGSIWLTLLLSRSQAEQLASAVNAGQFDRYGITEILFEWPLEVAPPDPPFPYPERWPRTASQLPREIPSRQRARRELQHQYASAPPPDFASMGRGLASHFEQRLGLKETRDLADQISHGLAIVFQRAWPDGSRADDVVQETAIRLLDYINSEKLVLIDGVAAMVATIGLRVGTDLWRRERSGKRQPPGGLLPLSRHLVDPGADNPEARAIHRESLTLVQSAIERLTSPQRDVVLRRFRGASFEAIEEELRISPPSARTTYSRALNSLRLILADMGVGSEDFSFIQPPTFPWIENDL